MGTEQDGDTAYDASTSAVYVEADDTLQWALGYPFALRAIGIGGADPPARVLDYGCGPGRFAERVARRHGVRVARRHGVRVVAVDASPEMLAIASERSRHPLVEYHRVQDNRLPFLADGSVDAAVSCFVLLVVPTRAQLRVIAEEVWRVLRPGGDFAILDPNPANVGVQFSMFRSGEPDVTYADGDRRVARLLLTDGRLLELEDYFWSAGTYQDVLTEAGFVDVGAETPLLADAPGLADAVDLEAHDYEVERRYPPFVVVRGRKPAA